MFQRMMDNIFGDLPFCFIYMDHILIYSLDLVSHQDHLQQVLQLCRDHGLNINLDKCVFAVQQEDFLGHHVSSSNSSPLQKLCSAISQFPCPADWSSLQLFLGMINFYRKLIHQAAKIVHPLTSALKVSPKNFSCDSVLLELQICSAPGSQVGSSCFLSSNLPSRWCPRVPRWCSPPEKNFLVLGSTSILQKETLRSRDKILCIWPSAPPSATSDFCWKVGSSFYLPTTTWLARHQTALLFLGVYKFYPTSAWFRKHGDWCSILFCWYPCGCSSWFLFWRFSFSCSLCQLWNPCSGFNFSSSLLQCFSDLSSVNKLSQPCSAPETVFGNSGSNFKLCAQRATSSFLWSVSSLLSLYWHSWTSNSWLSPKTLLPPTPWSVSP